MPTGKLTIAPNGQEILSTEIIYSDREYLTVCDRNCDKAFGLGFSQRPELPNDASADDLDALDNRVWLSDSEVGEAPCDPGSYEGGHGKPYKPTTHNKWCVRACERCEMHKRGAAVTIHDWSQRRYNQPWKHGLAGNPEIDTGLVFAEKD